MRRTRLFHSTITTISYVVVFIISTQSYAVAEEVGPSTTGKPTKFFTTENIAQIRDKPSLEGKIVELLGPYFLLFEQKNVAPQNNGSPEDLGEFIPVGRTPREKDFLGWIRRGEVQSWETDLAFRFTLPENRPPAQVYRGKEEILTALTEGKTIAPDLASRELPYPKTASVKLLPSILAHEEKEIQGAVYDVFQIAYLHVIPKKRNPDQMGLDIVFVVDTTRSMNIYLPSIKEEITRFVDELGRASERPVRFGLLGYRDRVKEKEDMDRLRFIDGSVSYDEDGVYRFAPLTSQHDRFLDRLNLIETTNVSSEDYAEALLDALYAAIAEEKDMVWESNTIRIVFILSDASAHTSDHPIKNRHERTLESISSASTKNSVRIIPLKIDGQLKDIEQIKDSQRATEQFTALANASAPWGEGSLVKIRFEKEKGKWRSEGFTRLFNKSVNDILERESEWYKQNADSILAVPEVNKDKNWTIFLENVMPETSKSTPDLQPVAFTTGWMVQPRSGPQTLEVVRLVTLEDIESSIFALEGLKLLLTTKSDQEMTHKLSMIEPSLDVKFDENRPIFDQVAAQLEGAGKLEALKMSIQTLRQAQPMEKEKFVNEIEQRIAELKDTVNKSSLWYTIKDDFSIGYIDDYAY